MVVSLHGAARCIQPRCIQLRSPPCMAPRRIEMDLNELLFYNQGLTAAPCQPPCRWDQGGQWVGPSQRRYLAMADEYGVQRYESTHSGFHRLLSPAAVAAAAAAAFRVCCQPAAAAAVASKCTVPCWRPPGCEPAAPPSMLPPPLAHTPIAVKGRSKVYMKGSAHGPATILPPEFVNGALACQGGFGRLIDVHAAVALCATLCCTSIMLWNDASQCPPWLPCSAAGLPIPKEALAALTADELGGWQPTLGLGSGCVAMRLHCLRGPAGPQLVGPPTLERPCCLFVTPHALPFLTPLPAAS